MNSIDYLLQAVPVWVDVLQQTQNSLTFKASSVKKSGKPGATYSLTLKMEDIGRIDVFEAPTSNMLPKCCIQRHINPDSSFCLYPNSSEAITSVDEANYWWIGLGNYLNCQDYATKHKEWPRDKGLSHGDAAQIQIKMEKIAAQLGWKNEILDSLFRNKGWLAGTLMRRRKDGKGFVNLRSPCPRGCKELHFPFRRKSCSIDKCNHSCKKEHKPILRRSCPHREAVEKLTDLEIERRHCEEKIIATIKKSGVQCCETMKSCPFAQDA